jgi:hypothetical protein
MADCTGNVCNFDSAAIFDFIVRRGNTFTYQLAFSTYASNQNISDAQPRDITSSTFLMQVKMGGVLALELNLDNNRMQIVPPNILVMLVSGIDMRLVPGEYTYDIEETAAGGVVSTPMAGRLTVTADVSQPS